MKRLSTIIMALALVLGMSQCKKQETPTTGNTTPSNPGVHITVNVGDQDGKDGKDNNGEKHNIAPDYGLFAFTQGDVLYVGHGGKYVGMLTFNGACFDGTIYPDANATDKLHFYFLGNADVTGTPTEGETTSLSISIANQSANLPVLSYGPSEQTYSAANTSYSATLKNKCALVKLSLVNPTTETVTLSGVPTVATVNFANPTLETAITATDLEDLNDITLRYVTTWNPDLRWVILLPGTDLTNVVTVAEGVESVMANNTHITSGLTLNNPAALPDPPAAAYAVKKSNGDLSQFTVNADGKKVYFSKANLRFVGFNNNNGSWSFHENQVDASYASPGYGNTGSYGEISSGYIAIPTTESTNDRFAWGLYGNHGMGEDDWPAITTNLSKADGNDWGCAFSETSPEGTNWRTLTIDEWNYLFNGRSQQKRFLKVTLKLAESGEPYAVQGILLFPDDYVQPTGLTRTITYNYNTSASSGSGYDLVDAPTGSNKWSAALLCTDPNSNSYKMLAAGAVFLPAAGYRIDNTYYQYYCHTQGVYLTGYMRDAYGYYWSSTSGAYNEFSHTSRAFYFDRSTVGETSSYMDRENGMCVRLVWDAN